MTTANKAPPRLCIVCARPFSPPRGLIVRGRGHTCSVACRSADQVARRVATSRLRVLGAVGDGLVTREIAEAAGLCASTTMEHLRALERDGVVESVGGYRRDVKGRPRRCVGWVLRAEAAE